LVGITVGAIFYPSKEVSIEEKLKLQSEITKLKEEKRQIEKNYQNKISIKEEVAKQYKQQTDSKLYSLKQENTSLKQKIKERIIKIIKPDGTIVEETIRESQTEFVSRVITKIRAEFKEKIDSIENKWKLIHEKRLIKIRDNYVARLEEKDKKIKQYEMNKRVSINQRRFGFSLGYLGNNEYFSSVQYDMFGPMFLDLHLGGNTNNVRTGIGIGVKF
jgi:hypothetical protein